MFAVIHRFISSRIALAVLAAALAAPASAVWKPATSSSAVKGETRKKVQQGVTRLRSIPKLTREGIMAEYFHLCYMINGSSALDSKKWVQRGAYFVGTDGKEHNWWNEHDEISGSDWAQHVNYIRNVGVELVFSAFAKDVTRLVQQTAKRHMKELPNVVRDGWLAEVAGLLYMPDGKKAYTGREIAEKVDDDLSVMRKEVRAGAMFTDAEGRERKLTELSAYKLTFGSRVKILHVCVQLVGRDDILALFTKELAPLRKNNARSLAAQREAAADSKATTSEDRKPAAPSLVLTDPKLKAAVEALKSLPDTVRQAYMAEMLHLTYMPDGSNPTDQWGQRKGSKFRGIDGKEYDFYREQGLIAMEEWVAVAKTVRRAEPAEVEAALADEAAALRREAAHAADTPDVKEAVASIKGLPLRMQEAFMAESFGLAYMNDGSSVTDSRGWLRPHAVFMGTDGQEVDFWEEHGKLPPGRWQSVVNQVKKAGAEKTLAHFAPMVKAMVYATARRMVQSMPDAFRDAWLAEAAGLLYKADGGSAYTGASPTFVTDSKQEVRFRLVDSHTALFTDTGGRERKSSEVWSQYSGQLVNYWHRLHLCAYLVGAQEILALFPNEVTLLREKFKKRTGREEGAGVTPHYGEGLGKLLIHVKPQAASSGGIMGSLSM